MSALDVIEHLVGMQAQSPNTPYVGLWSRTAGFQIDDLSSLYRSHDVVRIAAMRSTIHLVSARDCIALRNAVQPVIDRLFNGGYAKLLEGVDLDEMAALGRKAVEVKPMTFSQISRHLGSRWPDRNPQALAYGMRALIPLIQVPPRGIWGESGQASHTSAESWITTECPSTMTVEELMKRYLAAFGPAS
ncbi:MAG TPA: winged helix DNA-binding domain-containing protein, partial [Gemmatimonadaceae bacterium]|nr:winged helix DNA-binding domain-containing protein [Gemmatimonadaceae bacterium]